MFKIRDPLGLIEDDPKLKAKVDFHEKILVPVCLTVIVGVVLFIVGVVFYEIVIKG